MEVEKLAVFPSNVLETSHQHYIRACANQHSFQCDWRARPHLAKIGSKPTTRRKDQASVSACRSSGGSSRIITVTEFSRLHELGAASKPI
jgi:hypothetical protein